MIAQRMFDIGGDITTIPNKDVFVLSNEMVMRNGRVYGFEVSEYGIENGYLDYKTLSNIVGDMILNNTIRDRTLLDWEIATGKFDDIVFQDYIISERGYDILRQYTDELVFYNGELDLYIWSITHFGTSWDYVLTNVKLI